MNRHADYHCSLRLKKRMNKKLIKKEVLDERNSYALLLLILFSHLFYCFNNKIIIPWGWKRKTIFICPLQPKNKKDFSYDYNKGRKLFIIVFKLDFYEHVLIVFFLISSRLIFWYLIPSIGFFGVFLPTKGNRSKES